MPVLASWPQMHRQQDAGSFCAHLLAYAQPRPLLAPIPVEVQGSTLQGVLDHWSCQHTVHGLYQPGGALPGERIGLPVFLDSAGLDMRTARRSVLSALPSHIYYDSLEELLLLNTLQCLMASVGKTVPPSFSWTTVVITVNNVAGLHVDKQNAPFCSLVFGLSHHCQGHMWIQSTILDLGWRNRPMATDWMRAYLLPTFSHPHCTEASTQGDRLVLIAYVIGQYEFPVQVALQTVTCQRPAPRSFPDYASCTALPLKEVSNSSCLAIRGELEMSARYYETNMAEVVIDLLSDEEVSVQDEATASGYEAGSGTVQSAVTEAPLLSSSSIQLDEMD
ncbi:hypothetical protein AK812_SmicGene40229 [Symbiodinium microadriaticum]|uniref:Uncharacterized protein n=1 Tax=Symbiodinium microadriaticum TaxID=2951 RepID=A0A1Q9C987_SYMMI|nr:hypothetical protein AK812_SmicGene40229 [Symbiodinium microadriaticum]